MSIIEKVLDKIDKDKTGNDPESSQKKERTETATGDESFVNLKERRESSSAGQETVAPKKKKISKTIEIDFERLRRYGYLTPHSINITLSEQYRRIKSPILLNAFDKEHRTLKNRNLVMITSAIPGEGKSFTSFNLALSVAKEFNHTVLYIDADAAKSTMTRFLGLEGEAGLTDYLIDEKLTLPDVLLRTNIPKLTIMPSGKGSQMITELWSSKRMREMVLELSNRYDDRLIIFDTPPLLQDSSAPILTRFVGQIILVIEAEKTPQHIVDETLQMIKGSQYIGLVLNKSNIKLSSDYGYYNYVNFPKEQ